MALAACKLTLLNGGHQPKYHGDGVAAIGGAARAAARKTAMWRASTCSAENGGRAEMQILVRGTATCGGLTGPVRATLCGPCEKPSAVSKRLRQRGPVAAQQAFGRGMNDKYGPSGGEKMARGVVLPVACRRALINGSSSKALAGFSA